MRGVQQLAALAVCLATAGTLWGSTQIHTCVTSGSGPTYMKVCISTTGIVVKFESPKGMNHIDVQSDFTGKYYPFLEGFNVCWLEPDSSDGLDKVFSTGYEPFQLEDRWEAPYRIEQPGGSNTFPLRIYRRARWGRGVWELKQEFNRDTTERELTITMTLYNRSGELREDVRLLRFADPDIDNDSGDDADGGLGGNTIPRSAVIWEGNNVGNAVALTGLTAGADASTGDAGSPLADNIFWYCSAPSDDGGPDRIAKIGWYWSSIPAGGSKTVKLVYRAF